MPAKLPPPPFPPARRLTPPERKSLSEEAFPVEPDAKTPRKPVEFITYQALLKYFDSMTPDERNDLLEIAAALPDLSAEERKWVVEMATKR